MFRFRATNPGWWFAHCHVMLHNMHGMSFAFRVGEHDEVPKPPENFPHSCGVFEQEVNSSISNLKKVAIVVLNFFKIDGIIKSLAHF